MKKDIIVLMGGQGVGKGTFAKLLMQGHNFNHIETGALFRAMPADSAIGRLIARGELVPDDELFKLIASKITDDTDIILDGFPRTVAQAKWLTHNYADKYNIHVLYLDVPEEVMIARIEKRNREGSHRGDDADMAVVRRRLDTFWHVTMPAIEWLRTAPGIKFSDIDVTGPVDENMERITAALKK